MQVQFFGEWSREVWTAHLCLPFNSLDSTNQKKAEMGGLWDTKGLQRHSQRERRRFAPGPPKPVKKQSVVCLRQADTFAATLIPGWPGDLVQLLSYTSVFFFLLHFISAPRGTFLLLVPPTSVQCPISCFVFPSELLFHNKICLILKTNQPK